MDAPDPTTRGMTDLQRALAAVARAIADSLDVHEIWDRVAEACHTIVPFDAMGIVQLEPGDVVRAIGAAGDASVKSLEGQTFPRASYSPQFWPDADDFMVIIRDARVELDDRFATDRISLAKGFLSAIRVPLTHRGRRLGSVLLVAREQGRFTAGHGNDLKVVAELVAVALAHHQLATTLAGETRRRAAEHERALLLEQRVQLLSRELETLSPHRVLGTSKRWRDVLAQATKVASTDTTVLMTGESGTGKEVIARYIHRGSPRRDGPFVALNCAALPEQLLESELFGHEKGAFTGAVNAHAGKIEQAGGGVLFLDEVAEMSPAVQAKFLRVLQEREYQRLGGNRTLRAEVRVIAATNRDLKAGIARGTFREDLFYRLAVFDIALPPLRDRREDISLLADSFLEVAGQSVGRPAAGISGEAREILAAYAWPGNVRELRNVIERAVILCEGGIITSEHLPLDVAAAGARPLAALSLTAGVAVIPTADAAERDLIRQALASSGNNKSKAARILGLTRAQLRSRIEKHGLT